LSFCLSAESFSITPRHELVGQRDPAKVIADIRVPAHALPIDLGPQGRLLPISPIID